MSAGAHLRTAPCAPWQTESAHTGVASRPRPPRRCPRYPPHPPLLAPQSRGRPASCLTGKHYSTPPPSLQLLPAVGSFAASGSVVAPAARRCCQGCQAVRTPGSAGVVSTQTFACAWGKHGFSACSKARLAVKHVHEVAASPQSVSPNRQHGQYLSAKPHQQHTSKASACAVRQQTPQTTP